MNHTALGIFAHPDDTEFPYAGTMLLLADHPDVQFNYYVKGISVCETEMH